MASFNKVILMGNLTRDPELRYTPNGQAVCEFTIAMNHKYTTGGQEREEVCFVDIVVWARRAESCGKYLKKGSPALVEGRLKQDTWEDKEGRKRSKIRVNADNVQFVSTRNAGGETGGSPQSNYQGYSSQNTTATKTYQPVNNQQQPASHSEPIPPESNQPASYSQPMPEPPQDIYDNDFETEDDIPF